MYAAILEWVLFGGQLIKLAANAVWQLFLVLPNWVKLLAAVAIALVVVYYIGDHGGAVRVQAQWDAAQKAAIAENTKVGEDANAAAQASIPAVTPAQQAGDNAIAPRGKPCVVRDRFDRSCAGN